MTKICLRLLLAMFTGYIQVECVPRVRVYLHSDLITMVGQPQYGDNGNDICQNGANITSNETVNAGLAYKSLLLSQYSFKTMAPTCKTFDIARYDLYTFNWSCFTTGSESSRDINWFFVDCFRSKMASVKCLEGSQVNQRIQNVCGNGPSTCESFTTSDGQNHVCSKRFEIKRTVVESAERTRDGPIFPTQYDIIAFVCAAFILVTFFVTVCVPAEKCKPSYSYEDDMGLRVPLEIYEMYGQHYRPSARRKVKDAFTKAVGSISHENPNSYHLQNVAVVANKELDLNSNSAVFGSISIEMLSTYHCQNDHRFDNDTRLISRLNVAVFEDTELDINRNKAVEGEVDGGVKTSIPKESLTNSTPGNIDGVVACIDKAMKKEHGLYKKGGHAIKDIRGRYSVGKASSQQSESEQITELRRFSLC